MPRMPSLYWQHVILNETDENASCKYCNRIVPGAAHDVRKIRNHFVFTCKKPPDIVLDLMKPKEREKALKRREAYAAKLAATSNSSANVEHDLDTSSQHHRATGQLPQGHDLGAPGEIEQEVIRQQKQVEVTQEEKSALAKLVAPELVLNAEAAPAVNDGSKVATPSSPSQHNHPGAFGNMTVYHINVASGSKLVLPTPTQEHPPRPFSTACLQNCGSIGNTAAAPCSLLSARASPPPSPTTVRNLPSKLAVPGVGSTFRKTMKQKPPQEYEFYTPNCTKTVAISGFPKKAEQQSSFSIEHTQDEIKKAAREAPNNPFGCFIEYRREIGGCETWLCHCPSVAAAMRVKHWTLLNTTYQGFRITSWFEDEN